MAQVGSQLGMCRVAPPLLAVAQQDRVFERPGKQGSEAERFGQTWHRRDGTRPPVPSYSRTLLPCPYHASAALAALLTGRA